MTNRMFEIEWKDELGPMWMNEDNLGSCLFTDTYCTDDLCAIEDVTDELTGLRAKVEKVRQISMVSGCGQSCRCVACQIRAALDDDWKGE